MSLVEAPVLILKEGTQRAHGKDARANNIMSARAIAEAVRTALGPRGRDKMLVDTIGDIVITNDGKTILDEMEVQHPAAKLMVQVAKAQDKEVGDGTTTAVIIAGELLKHGEKLLNQKIHPTIIISGYKKASKKALEFLENIAEQIDVKDKETLLNIAKTSMNSKIIGLNKEKISEIAVDAALQVAEEKEGNMEVDIDLVQVIKKAGGAIEDSQFVKGIIIDKEVVHPGMPKRIENAKIALVNAALEIEKTEFNAEIRISKPEEIALFRQKEEEMLQSMVEKIANTGANVLFCQKGIDDRAQHYLAKKGILAVRRVKKSDMEKLSKATGAKIVNNIEEITGNDLGFAGLVEEQKVANDKMVFVENCKDPKAVSVLLRGGTERIVDEAERAFHDAICVLRDAMEDRTIVAGGGAIESEVAKAVRDFAKTIAGKEQLAINAFADAIESVPRTLAENAGLDPIEILTELRRVHQKGIENKWYGIDLYDGKVKDMYKENVIEPLRIKKQAVESAVEATTMILRIDDVIVAKKSPTKPPKSPGEGSSEY